MSQRQHQHRKIRSTIIPFTVPVRPEHGQHVAYGGCVELSICRCGASRQTAKNGRHRLRGPWVGGAHDDAD